MKTTNLLISKWLAMASLLLLTVPARAADAAQTPAAKPVRVACCGDSITCGAGTALPESDAYPKQLAALLGAGWEVQSFGVSGTTVFNCTGNPWAGHPERQAALAAKPDVVIIALGTNDCNPEKWKNKDQYLKDYRALIQMFRMLESKPKIYVATPLPFGPAQNDHLPGLKEQIVLIGQLAMEEKLTIIDMNAAMKGREDLIPDSVHPNTTGAGIMARTAFKALTGREAPSPAANPVPAGFVPIPAGEFSMGDALDGIPGAPVHKVTLSGFYMAKSLVTQAEWNEVAIWAATHGYQDLAVKEGKAADHPVHTVSWYDAVKWCNARSEKEALTPCYTVNGAVMRTGSAEPAVNWASTGYRLPTEAEWEKAARGGLNGKRFPWGDTISHSQANFTNDGGEAYATAATGPHPLWSKNDDPNCPHTSPVGSFPANGYGLFDMVGNVWQRCWDWYSWEPGPPTDPRGVATGTIRTLRGGSWRVGAESCRVAFRNSGDPAYASRYVGFRVVRSEVSADEPPFPIDRAPAPLFEDPVWHGASDPTVLWNPLAREFTIYYTQLRAALKNPNGVEWAHGTAIGIATSKDGVKWNYEGICTGDEGLGTPIESKLTWWAPSVLFHEGTLHMFVSRVDGIYSNFAGKRNILHFTSSDGRKWKYLQTLPLSSENCIDPCIYQIGAMWYVCYKDESVGGFTYLAESPDLKTWQVRGKVVSDVPHEGPLVWRWKGAYWMIVDTGAQLRIYRSANGIDGWEYHAAILQAPGKRPMDGVRGYHAGILVQGERAFVFYSVHYNRDNLVAALQVAELEMDAAGKIVCDRDRYAAK